MNDIHTPAHRAEVNDQRAEKSERVTVRFSLAELRRLDDARRRLGKNVSRSAVVRALLADMGLDDSPSQSRHAVPDYVPLDPDLLVVMQDIDKQIRGASANINTVARQINTAVQHGLLDADSANDAINALMRAASQLSGDLADVLVAYNVHGDGLLAQLTPEQRVRASHLIASDRVLSRIVHADDVEAELSQAEADDARLRSILNA